MLNRFHLIISYLLFKIEALLVGVFGKTCHHQFGYSQDIDDDEFDRIDAGTSQYKSYAEYCTAVVDHADKKCAICHQFFKESK